jgi:hypothetical protein
MIHSDASVSTEKSGEKMGSAINEFLKNKTKMENDKKMSDGLQFLQCSSCQAYRKVGTTKDIYATKKDTANQGITPRNTKQVSLPTFHSQ